MQRIQITHATRRELAQASQFMRLAAGSQTEVQRNLYLTRANEITTGLYMRLWNLESTCPQIKTDKVYVGLRKQISTMGAWIEERMSQDKYQDETPTWYSH